MEFIFDNVGGGGGGAGKDGFIRFVAGQDAQVVILTGAKSIRNKFNESRPKMACGVWNVKDRKVQIMDLKSTIGDTVKLVASTKPDWARTVFIVKRTGSGQTDTRYTVINTVAPTPMPDFEARCKEAEELIAKVLFAKPDEEAEMLGIKL